MTSSKKLVVALAGLVGLGGMLLTPVSKADGYYRHHWHPAGRMVKFRGCRKIIFNRFCRDSYRWGHQCQVDRRVRWVC